MAQRAPGQARYTEGMHPMELKAWAEDPETGLREYYWDWGFGGGNEEDIYLEEDPPSHLKRPIELVREFNEKLRKDNEEVRADIEANPLHFVCIYCKKNLKSLCSLEQHIFPKRSYTDTNRFEISCHVRKVDEECSGFVRKRHGKPGRFPWFYVTDRQSGQLIRRRAYSSELAIEIDKHIEKAKNDYYLDGEQ